MPGSMKTLADWLAYVEQLHAKPIDMGLERIRAVAQTLGLAFDCPVVTVAGTNGKGSTCAMLESILSNAGYRTAVCTGSPTVAVNRARCSGATSHTSLPLLSANQATSRSGCGIAVTSRPRRPPSGRAALPR